MNPDVPAVEERRADLTLIVTLLQFMRLLACRVGSALPPTAPPFPPASVSVLGVAPLSVFRASSRRTFRLVRLVVLSTCLLGFSCPRLPHVVLVVTPRAAAGASSAFLHRRRVLPSGAPAPRHVALCSSRRAGLVAVRHLRIQLHAATLSRPRACRLRRALVASPDVTPRHVARARTVTWQALQSPPARAARADQWPSPPSFMTRISPHCAPPRESRYHRHVQRRVRHRETKLRSCPHPFKLNQSQTIASRPQIDLPLQLLNVLRRIFRATVA